MKRTLLLATVMTANVFAVENKELMPLIEAASINRESAYVEIREKIMEYGTNAIPLLAVIAIDETLPWQQQLVARICYERIKRKEDIEQLLAKDWYLHPNFNPDWRFFITGPEIKMHEMIVPELRATGLWHYYLEMEWKMTGEKAKISEHHFPNAWVSWCSLAVKDIPDERIWFLRICSEIMAIEPPTQRWDKWLLPTLQREEKPDSAYLLEHRTPLPVSEEPPFRLGTNIVKRVNQP